MAKTNYRRMICAAKTFDDKRRVIGMFIGENLDIIERALTHDAKCSGKDAILKCDEKAKKMAGRGIEIEKGWVVKGEFMRDIIAQSGVMPHIKIIFNYVFGIDSDFDRHRTPPISKTTSQEVVSCRSRNKGGEVASYLLQTHSKGVVPVGSEWKDSEGVTWECLEEVSRNLYEFESNHEANVQYIKLSEQDVMRTLKRIA